MFLIDYLGSVVNQIKNQLLGLTQSEILTMAVSFHLILQVWLKGTNTQHSGHMGQKFSN